MDIAFPKLSVMIGYQTENKMETFFFFPMRELILTGSFQTQKVQAESNEALVKFTDGRFSYGCCL